ncbi:MAG: hypothetical protein GXY55_09255 [Phycisphaerae bacterium]|nr:hypothetical protein [Phycisphaerae bacterium]
MNKHGSLDNARKLGTFGGVFVPSFLTILGVIMFLRAGWVVANAGLLGALAILVISASITFLTSLSLSAVATNTRVGAGGAYFLVSRSLGLEIGGSVGVPLFFAQAISVAFYIVGFTESLQFIGIVSDPRWVACGVLALFFVVAWFGAGIIVKAQYLILVVLLASLASFFAGYSPVPDLRQNMASAYTGEHGFWTVLAIFFPAVTGIMSGLSMSGDLRNPACSIPRGTLGAVVTTFFIYAAHLTWLAINAERAELMENALVMQRIARVGPLVIAGLWAASLSSALASLAAAPRTLQALGTDGVAPRILGRGFGPNREPRSALVVATLVAAICIFLGDLNVIAPVITMFFLATYGTLNLVAGLERLVSNPSYRPSFNVHWSLSLAGCLGCLAVMLLINAIATVVAAVIIAGVFAVLTRRRLQATWGDMRSGLWFALTRWALLRFDRSRRDHRNWRPVILVLAGNPKARLRLVEFAQDIEARKGLLFLAQVVTGDWDKLLSRHDSFQKPLESYIQEQNLSAVAKTVMADDFEHGVLTLLQVGGIGQFEPNTVLVGWSEGTLKEAGFSQAVRRILQLQKNLLVFREAQENAELEPVIDIWWYAKDNGSLMLTLAHLLKAGSLRWREHRIRVRRIITDPAGVDKAEAGTREMIAGFRVRADIDILVSQEPALQVIARESRLSAVAFVGVAIEAVTADTPLLDRYAPLVSELQGNVVITKSWHDLNL